MNINYKHKCFILEVGLLNRGERIKKKKTHSRLTNFTIFHLLRKIILIFQVKSFPSAERGKIHHQIIKKCQQNFKV